MTIPTLTLNNGLTMPALGYGVFQTPADETQTVVEEALRVGYRHIDTAAAYGNEKGVGAALASAGIARDELVIETKVWVSDYGYDQTLHAFEKATRKLGIDVIDILILHQPAPDRFEKTIDAYKALEKLLADGGVRAIGVSNFMRHHLDDLLAKTDVVPALNQIEVHPYFSQQDVQAADTEHRILTQAWSPIGGITFYPGWNDGDKRSVLEDPAIASIAESHGKTPAQVMLRWHLQQGRSAIPKSVKPERIAENFAVGDFELTADDLIAIDSLDTGERGGPDPDGLDTRRFERVIPED
jgi:diketogulonate reductase-like aldo/keto reductase